MNRVSESKKENNSYNVLIVEDDEADLFLIKKQIEKIWPNCKIMAVQSLQKAYETYRNTQVDLTLLDLNLPDGYGALTVKEMRKFNKSVPIIVITGFGTNMTVYDALKMGANNVVLKSQVTDPDFVNILEQNVYSIP